MRLISILSFALRPRVEIVREIGQIMGEVGGQHPLLSDPLEPVFALAYVTKLSPADILEWDAEVFALYASYVGGVGRGREIASKRLR